MRRSDWLPRLAQYVLNCTARPLVPGTHDCMLFAAGWVDAVTGTDLAEGWRGRYTTMRGGLRILRRAGYTDHVALLRHHLPELAVARATPGDLALIDTDDGLGVAGVQGAALYALLDVGLITLPLSQATTVFGVR